MQPTTPPRRFTSTADLVQHLTAEGFPPPRRRLAPRPGPDGSHEALKVVDGKYLPNPTGRPA